MVDAVDLYAVLQRIRPVHELSARAVGHGLAGTELTVPLRAVLERLHIDGPQPVPAIARGLYVTRQGVQALVDRAKDLGLVESRPNPDHRRSHLVALTATGDALFTSVHTAELERLTGLAGPLDSADVTACVRVLDQLVTGLEHLADRPARGATPATSTPETTTRSQP